MSSFTHKYQICFKSFGRGFASTEEMDESDINAWKAATNILESITYNFENISITINIDWNPVYQAMIDLKNYEYDENISEQDDSIHSFDNVLIECSLTGVWDRSFIMESSNALHYLELYLYYAYLALNLSSPGSFTFYEANIALINENSTEPFFADSYLMEMSWINSLDHGWPEIHSIPLEDVWQWITSLKIGLRQLGNSSVEKVLFSLLHISCKPPSFPIEPMAIIWIAHSLEALYEIPTALSHKYLLSRVTQLLSIDPKKQKSLKKSLDNFYVLRNKIAHGGAPVIHPIGHDIWDKSILPYVDQLYDSSEFGASIIVATLQKFIINKWCKVKFDETFNGLPT